MKYLLIAVVGLVNIGYSQNSVNSSGGDLSGSGSISYSVGQITTKTIANSGGTLFEGVQRAEDQYTTGIMTPSVVKIEIVAYPIPTSGNVTLKSSGNTTMSYSLYNNQGALLLSGVLNNGSTIIETEHLSNGIYNLKVTGKHNLNKNIKIIKN